MSVLRLGAGQRWTVDGPAWSDLSAVGWFSLERAGFRFDRHHHSCPEYWAVVEGRARVAVGAQEYDVAPGDLVCTPAGVEHDILRAYTDDLRLFFFVAAVPEGQPAGHLHREPEFALGHDVGRPGPPAG
ncbi:cupin domain-containing protein [Micromonospora oryzae]|uniref:cupin domain-containing protein n=1 Tax=Micromonospora sp. DSM 102119 TaxID=3111768 RepID=UPI0031E20DC6